MQYAVCGSRYISLLKFEYFTRIWVPVLGAVTGNFLRVRLEASPTRQLRDREKEEEEEEEEEEERRNSE
jgi:hypothetical protein